MRSATSSRDRRRGRSASGTDMPKRYSSRSANTRSVAEVHAQVAHEVRVGSDVDGHVGRCDEELECG